MRFVGLRHSARALCLTLGLLIAWALSVACGEAGGPLFDLSWSGGGTDRHGSAAPGGSVSAALEFYNELAGVTSFAADVPDGFSAGFAPEEGTGKEGTVTVTFDVPEDAALGDYTVTIVAATPRAGGGISNSNQLTYRLTVADLPDFTVQVDPTEATWTEAGAKTFTFSITPLNGFDRSVSAELSALPAGFSLTLPPTSPLNVGEQGDFEITWDGTVSRQTADSVTLTLTSDDPEIPLERSLAITLRTEGGGPGSFELALSPGEFRFDGPNTIQTIEYSIIPRNGFTGTVDISIADDQVAGLLVNDGPTPASVDVGPTDPVSGTFDLYWDGNPLPSPAEIAVAADSGGTHLVAQVRILPN